MQIFFKSISDTFICKLDVNKDTNKHLTKNYTFLDCKKFSQEFGGTVCSCIPQSHVHVPFIISVRSQKQQNSGIKPITHHTSLWFIKLPLPSSPEELSAPITQTPTPAGAATGTWRDETNEMSSVLVRNTKIREDFGLIFLELRDLSIWCIDEGCRGLFKAGAAAVAYLKPEQSLFLCLCRSWDFGIVVGSNLAACILSTAVFDLSTLIFSIITKIRNQYL